MPGVCAPGYSVVVPALLDAIALLPRPGLELALVLGAEPWRLALPRPSDHLGKTV